MTKTTIKRAFRKLDATEQADVLKDLPATLAEALSEEDRFDAEVFEQRQAEEPKARGWSEVRAKIDARNRRKRSP